MVCCLPTNVPNSSLAVELKIPDCDHCVKIVTEVIPKFKGVESCVTDTENQMIALSGSFNLEKLLKKLNKLTGEEMEVVKKEEKGVESEIVQKGDAKLETIHEKDEVLEKENELKTLLEADRKSEEDAKKELEKIKMFSDEDRNAKCTIS